MKSQIQSIELNQTDSISGKYRPIVKNRDGSVVKDYGWQKNLILPAGYATADSLWGIVAYCHAGTGTTPNKVVLDGTFSQAGTTVTRATGAGVFSSANVNDFIKFASGEIAKITAFTNSLTVVVDRSQTVAAAALTVYDTSRVSLDAFVKITSTLDSAKTITQKTDERSATVKAIFNFSFETIARIYNELGVSYASTGTSQLFSRIVLDTPVAVDVDQFLQVEFSVTAIVSNYGTSQPIAVSITGWPYPYQIASITASGTYFDVLLTEDHHYAVGRPIIISGALPVKTAVTTYASTGSDFTVNSTAHGKTVGQSIVIEGATPAGYNGTWTVATVPNANSFTVTSGINPGAGTGGTVRLATPATWFDGTWTILSFPTSKTIRIASAITPPPAGASGNVTNSTAASAIVCGIGYSQFLTGNYGGAMDPKPSKAVYTYTEAQLKTGLAYGVSANLNGGLTQNASAALSYDSGNRIFTYTATIPSQATTYNIRQIALSGGTDSGTTAGGIMITFDERQVKMTGYQLVVTFKHSWEPVLD